MPFYIRKSFRAGPIRFNLSKSGIGVSAGVKGIRVGAGPRGSYVHMGRGGLYYRKQLSAPKKRTPRSSETRKRESALRSDGLEEIESLDVANMKSETTSDLILQLNSTAAKWRSWPFILFVGLVATATAGPVAIPIFALLLGAAIWFDNRNRQTALAYLLEDDPLADFESLTRCFDDLSLSKKIWLIEAAGHTDDRKRNAGANVIVQRNSIRPDFRLPKIVRSNLTAPMIPAGKQSLYFLPDLLLIQEGSRFGVVEYSDLECRATITNFVEEQSVPSDSKIIDHTWRYVNKNGGPDRRFNDNRQIPVVEYLELDLKSRQGLKERFQISSVEHGQKFVDGIKTYKKALNLASSN